MIIDLALTDFEAAYRIQRELVAKRKLGEIADSLLIAEHPPIFTLGRAGKIENLLVDGNFLKERGIKFLRVDRGGDITFHGPGQLVLYPIIDLNNRGRDLHRYLRDLEEVAMLLLADYGLLGKRIEGRTGIWIGDSKVSSIGIGATNWITYHGMSVNIDTDLRYFYMIYPCGIKGAKVANLNDFVARRVTMNEVKKKVVNHFGEIFLTENDHAPDRYAAVA